jgi:hypothetical protein
MKPRGVVCQQAASKTLYCVIGTAKELCGFEEHTYLTRKTENTQALFVNFGHQCRKTLVISASANGIRRRPDWAAGTLRFKHYLLHKRAGLC